MTRLLQPKDPVIETINTYNNIASAYKERYISSGDSNIVKPYLDIFLSHLPKNRSRILDIGSGAGFDAKYLSEHDCLVTSIDMSERFLEIAQVVAPKALFIRMDARKMDFQKYSFDGIWASASLLHIPKKEIADVLSSIHSILKNNGIFFVAIKKGKGEGFVINRGKENLSKAKRYFSYYTKAEFVKLLNAAGFTIDRYIVNTTRENTFMNFFCKKT